ncbi:neutral protease [Geomicrobium sp. JCM 19039]|nr:neutral protease [Geomicrobium sp. JCM 19039]
MKKFYYLCGAAALFLSSPSLSLSAENGNVPEANDEKSRILLVENEVDDQAMSTQESRGTYTDQALNFIQSNQDVLGIAEPDQELELIEETEDEHGMTHIRYQQVVNGVPVEGHQLLVHFNADGTMSSVNGNYHEAQSAVSTSAVHLSTEDAVNEAKHHVDAPDHLEYKPTVELIMYPMGDELVTVYKVNINFMGEEPGDWHVFVNAENGEIVDRYNTIGHLAEDAGLEVEDISPAPVEENPLMQIRQLPEDIDRSDFGPMHGSGFGVLGDYRVLNMAYKISDIPQGTFKLYDWTRPDFEGIYTYDMKNQFPSSGFGLPGDPFTNDTAGFNSSYDAPGVDAHYNSLRVYEYYLEEHGRNSLDDEGAPSFQRPITGITSITHFGMVDRWPMGMEMDSNSFHYQQG